MSYPSSPLSPYLGALELQFAPDPFYTFVDLYLIILYQLDSLHLDDYNLIYSQNKNRGLDKILTTFPLKTQHFPFTNITQNQSKLFLSTFGVFPNIKITKDEACKTRENSNFLKKDNKIVILVKIRNFSRSRMTKRTSPLEYSCEI